MVYFSDFFYFYICGFVKFGELQKRELLFYN